MTPADCLLSRAPGPLAGCAETRCDPVAVARARFADPHWRRHAAYRAAADLWREYGARARIVHRERGGRTGDPVDVLLAAAGVPAVEDVQMSMEVCL